MELRELIQIASRGYDPDGLVLMYHDSPEDSHWGDSLAEFVAIELRETFGVNESDQEQLDVGIGVMESAVSQLQGAVDELSKARLLVDDASGDPEKESVD